MRDIRFLLKDAYAVSRALVIGINAYADVSPLSYAVSDATAVRDVLISSFGFLEEHLIFITDEGATKQKILSAYHRFTNNDVGLDDRIIIFYAGHGHTLPGIRGDIGFLVPHDADPNDTSSLIRWDELTRNAELIRAKHLLFIMDACYGGLALTRSAHTGSARFLQDMMLRYSRQVLTAGKADEVVADSGGPLPNHSVFTGHLLEGLNGKAEIEEGIITASGLMSYVYSKVAGDKNSNQTPHHGHFDGDGDLILKCPSLSDELSDHTKTGRDRLLILPFPSDLNEPIRSGIKIERVKQLITNEASAIDLHDKLMHESLNAIAMTREELFSVSMEYTDKEFFDRLNRYENAVDDLSLCVSVVSHWANSRHISMLRKAVSRFVDPMDVRGGRSVWLALRWYPVISMLYAAGIAAIDANNYESLAALFNAESPSLDGSDSDSLLIDSVTQAISKILQTKVFEKVPGHERYYTPFSEYLFKQLQPRLDELFFLGKGYERAFDTLEVFLALVSSDSSYARSGNYSYLPGRFYWKHNSLRSTSPLDRVLSEAKAKKADWLPFKAGMFDGSIERVEAAVDHCKRVISQI